MACSCKKDGGKCTCGDNCQCSSAGESCKCGNGGDCKCCDCKIGGTCTCGPNCTCCDCKVSGGCCSGAKSMVDTKRLVDNLPVIMMVLGAGVLIGYALGNK